MFIYIIPIIFSTQSLIIQKLIVLISFQQNHVLDKLLGTVIIMIFFLKNKFVSPWIRFKCIQIYVF